jgi:membrane-associated phospholipid phosphatase
MRQQSQDFVLWVIVALLLVGTVLGELGGGHHAGFLTLNHGTSYLPDVLWELITRLGDERLLLALSLLLARHRPEIFWAMLLAALFGTLYSRGLKPLVDALRPPAVLPVGGFELIGPGHRNHSFPSGHTLSAFVFVGVLSTFIRDAWVRALLIAVGVLVGVSRVAVGVHWPQDAIAGACGGLFSAWLGTQLALRWRAGLQPPVHLIMLVVPLLAAIDLFFNDGGYPATRIVGGLIGFSMLAQFANDYGPFTQRSG